MARKAGILAESVGARMLLGGRLAVDFANIPSDPGTGVREPSWEELVEFLDLDVKWAFGIQAKAICLSVLSPSV